METDEDSSNRCSLIIDSQAAIYTKSGIKTVMELSVGDRVFDAFGCDHAVLMLREVVDSGKLVQSQSGRDFISHTEASWLGLDSEQEVSCAINADQNNNILLSNPMVRLGISNQSINPIDYLYGKYIVKGLPLRETYPNIVIRIQKKLSQFQKAMDELDLGNSYILQTIGDTTYDAYMNEQESAEIIKLISSGDNKDSVDGRYIEKPTLPNISIIRGIGDSKMIRCSKRIVLDFESRLLSKQIRDWLLRLGIECSLQEMRDLDTTKYRIVIKGWNINWYNAIIGSSAGLCEPYFNFDVSKYADDNIGVTKPLHNAKFYEVSIAADKAALLVNDYIQLCNIQVS